MKLIIAIVKDADSLVLLDALSERHLGATKLASTGGFLREGNTTLLIGVDDDRVEEVLELIRASCPRRVVARPDFTPQTAQIPVISLPINVETGGAIVFVLPIEASFRL